jgi:hypothetical protein
MQGGLSSGCVQRWTDGSTASYFFSRMADIRMESMDIDSIIDIRSLLNSESFIGMDQVNDIRFN